MVISACCSEANKRGHPATRFGAAPGHLCVLFSTPSSVPTSSLSAEPSEPAILLLSTWEHGRPVGATPVSPALRDAFVALVVEAIAGEHDINLDSADVRAVLAGATGLAVGRAGGSGPGRAQRALADAWDRLQAVDFRPVAEGRILLSIRSREEHELGMDELTLVAEALQQATGPAWETIFGHGVVPNQTEEICIGFLLAPRGAADELARHQT